MKLTESSVKKIATPELGSVYEWDGELSGFGLRVYSTGLRSFVYRYTTRDRRKSRRTMVLGDYGTLTVAQARTQAERARARVLDGKDPLSERQRDQKDMTLKAFVEKLFLPRSQRRRVIEDARRLRKHIIPTLGAKRLSAITRPMVADLHARLTEQGAPVEANRVVQLLRTVFERAKEWGNLPEQAVNPAKANRRGPGVTLNPERSRTRWLDLSEVERLVAAVDSDDDVFFRAFVRLALLTGCRKNELLGARWADVDMEGGQLRLRETKSGVEQERVLSPAAVALLQAMPREAGSQWLFPGDEGEHRRDFKRQWGRARLAAGLPDVTIHDLRRTVGSHLAQSGVPLEVVGSVLGHARNPAVTRVYARLSQRNEADAMEAAGERFAPVLGLGSGPERPSPEERAVQAAKEAVDEGADPTTMAARLRELAAELEKAEERKPLRLVK